MFGWLLSELVACLAQGLKGIDFSNDGRKFLSTGYDKVIKLWDTETGQVLRTFGEGKMFFVAKFHPNDDKQNVLMAGCQDKKVGQQCVGSSLAGPSLWPFPSGICGSSSYSAIIRRSSWTLEMPWGLYLFSFRVLHCKNCCHRYQRNGSVL